jgi:hypothetical protein
MVGKLSPFLLLAAVLLTACVGSPAPVDLAATDVSPTAAEINAAAERAAATGEIVGAQPSDSPVPDLEPEPTLEPTRTPQDDGPVINRRVEVGEIGRFPQLIPFDGIRPVYDPQFAPAGEAALEDDELIIGIAIDGEAKAYPITVLRFREMVNDELAGIPTLVTW